MIPRLIKQYHVVLREKRKPPENRPVLLQSQAAEGAPKEYLGYICKASQSTEGSSPDMRRGYVEEDWEDAGSNAKISAHKDGNAKR